MFDETMAGREDWNAQTRENSSRGAWAFGTATSKGWGELLIAKPIMFGLTFVQTPYVSYSFAMDDDNQLVDNRFPRCSGGVARWIQDSRNFYVGAHVMVTVGTSDPILSAASLWNQQMLVPPVPSDYIDAVEYDLTHHWMFFGLAIKDINAQMFQG